MDCSVCKKIAFSLPAMLARDIVAERKITELAHEVLSAPELAWRLESVGRAINGLNYRLTGYQRLVFALDAALRDGERLGGGAAATESAIQAPIAVAGNRLDQNFRPVPADLIAGLVIRLRRLEESVSAAERLGSLSDDTWNAVEAATSAVPDTPDASTSPLPPDSAVAPGETPAGEAFHG